MSPAKAGRTKAAKGSNATKASTAAAQLLWTRPAAPEAPHPAHDAWRFSGRWWARPMPMRRERPWVRG